MSEFGMCSIPGCGVGVGRYPIELCWEHVEEAAYLYEKAITDKERAVRAASRADAEAGRMGWLYFMQIGDQIKVGFTFQAMKRLRQYPPASRVLAVDYRAKPCDEVAMHDRLAQYRVAGREWYRDCPAVRDVVAEVLAEHGKPVQVRWGSGQRRQRATVAPPRRASAV